MKKSKPKLVLYYNIGNMPGEKGQIYADTAGRRVAEKFSAEVCVIPVRDGETRIQVIS